MQINSDSCLNQIFSERDMRLLWQMMQELIAVVGSGGGGDSSCLFTYRSYNWQSIAHLYRLQLPKVFTQNNHLNL